MNPNEKALKSSNILLRFLVYGIILAGTLPFVFKNLSPGHDPYYMAYSMGRFLTSGQLPGAMSVAYEFTPLYYIFYTQLFKILSINPQNVLIFLNYFDCAFSFLFLIVFEITLIKLEKRRESPLFVLMLFLIPVFWHVSLYAHPVTLSYLFFFLSLLSFMNYVSADESTKKDALFIASIILYVVSLLFRIDAVFLILMFPALLFALKKESVKSFTSCAIFMALSIFIFTFVRVLIIGNTGYSSDFEELLAPSTFMGWKLSLECLLRAVGIGGAIVFFMSLGVLIAKREWRRAVLPLSGILGILIVLLPSTMVIRRLYHLAPLVIMLAYFAFLALKDEQKRNRLIAYFLSALVIFNFIGPALITKAEDTFKISKDFLYKNILQPVLLAPLEYDIFNKQRQEKAFAKNIDNISEKLLLSHDKPVIVIAYWRDIGAISYHLFTRGAVEKEYNFEDFTGPFSQVIELKNGNKIILCEREIAEGVEDPFKYFVGNSDKYKGYYMVLIAREDTDNIELIKSNYKVLHFSEKDWLF